MIPADWVIPALSGMFGVGVAWGGLRQWKRNIDIHLRDLSEWRKGRPSDILTILHHLDVHKDNMKELRENYLDLKFKSLDEKIWEAAREVAVAGSNLRGVNEALIELGKQVTRLNVLIVEKKSDG